MDILLTLKNDFGQEFSLLDYRLADIVRLNLNNTPIKFDTPIFIADDVLKHQNSPNSAMVNNPLGTLSENVAIPPENRMFIEFDVSSDGADTKTFLFRCGAYVHHAPVNDKILSAALDIDEVYSAAKTFISCDAVILGYMGDNNMLFHYNPFNMAILLDEMGFVIRSDKEQWHHINWNLERIADLLLIHIYEYSQAILTSILINLSIMHNHGELDYQLDRYPIDMAKCAREYTSSFIECIDKRIVKLKSHLHA